MTRGIDGESGILEGRGVNEENGQIFRAKVTWLGQLMLVNLEPTGETMLAFSQVAAPPSKPEDVEYRCGGTSCEDPSCITHHPRRT